MAHPKLGKALGGVVAALFVLAVVQVGWLATRTRPERPIVPSSFAPGDQLPDVPLYRFTADSADGIGESSLHDLVPAGGCALLIFFDSACPGCERVAPDWDKKSEVRLATGGSLTVRWIAARSSDSDAVEFVRRHRLASPWFMVESLKDRRELGIRYVPFTYLVRAPAVVLGQPLPLSKVLDTLATDCGR